MEQVTVFVGHPYAFPLDDYRGAFAAVEGELAHVRFLFADYELSNRHILDKIREMIRDADISLFDVTGWNPNVTLELGLAMGLGVDYFVLFDPREGRGVPSDLGGIDRLEYASFTQLRDGLKRLLVQEFGAEGVPGQPRRARRAIDRIRNRITEGTDNVRSRDVEVAVYGGFTGEVVQIALAPNAGNHKQKQVALALLDVGRIAEAIQVAKEIQNRSQTESVVKAALDLVVSGGVADGWSVVIALWPRLRAPQRRNVRERIEELGLDPPDDLTSIATDDGSATTS